MTATALVEKSRFNMIEQQIRPWDVHDLDVLDLLASIRREDYVPPVHRAMAFFDMEIPLKDGGEAGHCMLSPKVEARILNDLKIERHERILEIGTGSGFMAALLAHRGREVLTLEIDAELARSADETLRRNGVGNALVELGDGAALLPTEGSFEVIVLSGSVARVPDALLSALTIGGRLAVIVGHEPMMRATFVTRRSQSEWLTVQPWDTIAPRLLNFPEPSRFSF